MAKLDFKNIQIKSIFGSLTKNLSWLFLFGFLLLLVLEVFEVKQSIQIILSANSQPALVTQEHGVRIDFTGYDRILKRIQNAQNFTPSPDNSAIPDPFGSQLPPPPPPAPVATSTAPASKGQKSTGYNDSSGVLQVP